MHHAGLLARAATPSAEQRFPPPTVKADFLSPSTVSQLFMWKKIEGKKMARTDDGLIFFFFLNGAFAC